MFQRLDGGSGFIVLHAAEWSPGIRRISVSVTWRQEQEQQIASHCQSLFLARETFRIHSPMQVSLEIDVLLLAVEMSTFASLVHSGSLRPYPLGFPSAPGQ